MRGYFRPWLSGHDYARGDNVAAQMRNLAYAVGDADARVALLVDPAHAPLELVDLVTGDGLEVVGVVATHYHPDHVGGNLGGRHVEGLAELLAVHDLPVHVQGDEAPWVSRVAGVDPADLVAHGPGDVLSVGSLRVTLIHTPGHTPGSQCLLVDGRLLTGDTLFLDGCGRVDLPGADPGEMYRSLHERLASLGDDVVVWPGHFYSDQPSAPLGVVRATNAALAPVGRERWLATFGA